MPVMNDAAKVASADRDAPQHRDRRAMPAILARVGHQPDAEGQPAAERDQRDRQHERDRKRLDDGRIIAPRRPGQSGGSTAST